MQTWEYRTIKVETKGVMGGILDTSSFDALLNQLGSDGWELDPCPGAASALTPG